MAPNGVKAVGILDQDIAFSLDRLFDEYNMDHIPHGKRLDGLAKRDLAHIKHYKAAVNIFGSPHSRRRVIIAPSMETPFKRRIGLFNKETPTTQKPFVLSTDLQPPPPPSHVPTEEEEQKRAEEKEFSEYKSWMSERKKFRKDLDGMGLSENYLKNKTNKTDLEKRVMGKMDDISREKVLLSKKKPIPPPSPVNREMPPVPKIASPAPRALQILDEHTKKKRLRVLDLFTEIDKDKDWKVTKEKFNKAIKTANLPITHKEIEDMIVCLDDDINDELDYSELFQGIKTWQKERRDSRKLGSQDSGSSIGLLSDSSDNVNEKISRRRSSAKSGSKTSSRPQSLSPVTKDTRPRSENQTADIDQTDSRGSKQKPSLSSKDGSKVDSVPSSPFPDYPDVFQTSDGLSRSASRGNNSISGSRSSTPQYLAVPDFDTRPERMVLSSDEEYMDLVKHDREVLRRNKYRKKHGITAEDEPSPGVIKIGDKTIDDHSTMSTLCHPTAVRVDNFRQKRLRDYESIVKLCKERGVVLTRKLLDRVLLYPADTPYHLMFQKPSDDEADGKGKPRVSSSNKSDAKLNQSKTVQRVKSVKSTSEISKQEKDKDEVKRCKSRDLDIIDRQFGYRKSSQVRNNVTKETLSTGKALIRTKVDCWMTFEEYNRLASQYQSKFNRFTRKADDNAFWPGQLLHKLRLCLPPYDSPPKVDTQKSLFTSVKSTKKSNPGYNNDVSWWPIGETGYLQTGNFDRFYRKS